MLEKGILPGPDGLIYLCTDPTDSAKFLYIRGHRDIIVYEVKVPKKLSDTIIETFDHSPTFFQCRAFASTVPIPVERLGKLTRYQI